MTTSVSLCIPGILIHLKSLLLAEIKQLLLLPLCFHGFHIEYLFQLLLDVKMLRHDLVAHFGGCFGIVSTP